MKGSAVPVLAFPDFKLPFILTTDASKVAIRAILSQVQNGIECPIAYASRQLNNAERAYTVSEQEMWFRLANKHFQYYLFGKQFLVRTDHSALKYLQNFPDQNSRLMRWSLKLSELDFVVEHRTGSKIGHVDAPSRHVGAILQEEITASPDKIKAVKQYPTPKSVKDRAFIGLASSYRRLVPDFAELAKPLTTLTRKDQQFTWGPTQQEAFESLKESFAVPLC